jgi:hypothetical protein
MIRVTFLIVILTSLIPVSAFANMAKPWHEGAVGAEGVGVEGIHVVHEALSFKLERSPEHPRPIDQVRAVYELRNEGPAQDVELQFVAAGMTEETPFEVHANGTTVPARFAAKHPVPPTWSVPESTPTPDGETSSLTARTEANAVPSLLFTVPMREGPNEVEVKYRAEPSMNSHGRYWLYQTAYVLAPARGWESFGTLDVEVRVPEGHDVASSLELRPEGDYLRGSFEGIPADSFTIATQRRPPFGALWLWYLLVVGGGFAASFLVVRKATTRAIGTLAATIVACLVAVPLSIVALFVGELPLGPSAPEWGYLLLFFGVPITGIAGVIVGIALVLRAALQYEGESRSNTMPATRETAHARG